MNDEMENENVNPEATDMNLDQEQVNDVVENNEVNQPENNQDPALKIAELQAKADDANDKYLRLYSEFDNFRKRTAKERLDLIATAGQDVFKIIIPLLDDFERAIKNNENTEDLEAVKEGFKQIYNKTLSSANSKGLEAIVSTGTPFDADLHEAITNIPAPNEEMKGKVVDEIEKAYKLNGKVIRFAKVIIGQ
jgi:molecular chaperone GrpE